MKEAEEKILINVGEIPLQTVEEWARKSARFNELISDEKRIQDAFASSQERLKNIGVPQKFIQQIPLEVFDVALKRAFGIIYARAAVEKFFQGKTREEVDREIFNEEWICATYEEAMQWHVEAAVMAVENAMIRDVVAPGIVAFIGSLVCGDDSPNNGEEDSEGKSDNP